MTIEDYEEVKQNHIDYITNYIKKEGNLFPCITIIADKIKKESSEEGKIAVIHMPISANFMKSDDSKEDFIKNILPDVFKEVKKEFVPYATIWVAESWVRQGPKDFNFEKDDYTKLPINKEVVFMLIETKDKQEAIILEIKRSGMQVNEAGEMIDTIDLIPSTETPGPEGVGGRFSGLFKIFNQQ